MGSDNDFAYFRAQIAFPDYCFRPNPRFARLHSLAPWKEEGSRPRDAAQSKFVESLDASKGMIAFPWKRECEDSAL